MEIANTLHTKLNMASTCVTRRVCCAMRKRDLAAQEERLRLTDRVRNGVFHKTIEQWLATIYLDF